MVSNSLSRRRHVIAPPAICRPPPPPRPPPYPPPGCTCGIAGIWHPGTKQAEVGWTGWLHELPDADPVVLWMHSTPDLGWTNPYADQNHIPHGAFLYGVPPGTTFIVFNAGWEFSTGRKCSAHLVLDTPGA